MSTTAESSLTTEDPGEDSAQVLPPQCQAGLQMDATIRAWPWHSSQTHNLDLRITNLEDDSKHFVSVEAVTLGDQYTQFHRPPAATLYRRGAWIEYPRAASWDFNGKPLPLQQPLSVVVRYQDRHGLEYAFFRWNVLLDRGAPYPATAPAEPARSNGFAKR